MLKLNPSKSELVTQKRRQPNSAVNCVITQLNINPSQSSDFRVFGSSDRSISADSVPPSKPSGNVFANERVTNSNMRIFATDVLIHGILSKKGKVGWQTWKNRSFVLRGQELKYYTVESNGRNGALKGRMFVGGAKVQRVGGNVGNGLAFSLHCEDASSTRILAAPDTQTLMDWLTSLTIASSALIVSPTPDQTLLDHSRTTRLILIRHGHYHTPNDPNTAFDSPLTPMGLLQAQLTGQYLHEYLSTRSVFKRYQANFPICHTGVCRTVETAQCIVNRICELETKENPNFELSMREEVLFREAWPSNPYPTTNRTTLIHENVETAASDCARLRFVYRNMFRHLIPSDLDAEERPIEKEEQKRFANLYANITRGNIRPRDRYRVIVCHANIIRWFICQTFGIDGEGVWGKMRYHHCGITEFEIDSVGNIRLCSMNHTGHLRQELVTESF
uniref:Serine/threonine-protein phosphatase PGAM5, mitochondrial n=1 Tax=Albugo laibachii Nc14 TaxID=890382 RepID=F0WNP4_9STRA|nr:conserved hypothetical protein [Albugo laibachii Nc14]|eukprot:CCA22935.1 conserved hypothetical protein [Albugo laibachii Nc14]